MKDNNIVNYLDTYKLARAEILYYPEGMDSPQTYIWQDFDRIPDYPRLRAFIGYWRQNKKETLHSILLTQAYIGNEKNHFSSTSQA